MVRNPSMQAVSLLWLGLLAMPAMAQSSFSSPGTHIYTVPPGTGALQVVVQGAGGGGGGMDDGPAGNGAPGARVSASIAVQGGETVHIHVGEGGGGASWPGASGLGGLAGAGSGGGGAGGNPGSLGSSPGGGGGGGASSVAVAGAFVRAGGGGGAPGQTIIRPWNVPALNAINALAFHVNDTNCGTAANGSPGESADISSGKPVDGPGGGGGGGGYASNAGVGGVGVQERLGPVAQPGTSGASCTLEAGSYKISQAVVSQDTSTAALGEPSKMTGAASGVNGLVTIQAIAAPPAPPAPVPSLGAWGLAGLGAWLAWAGLRQRKRV